MINRIIAYNIAELENKTVLSEAKNLHKSNVINEQQWLAIAQEFASTLFTPSFFMKALMFIISLIGMITILVPLGFIFSGAYDSFGISGIRVVVFLLGCALLFFTEMVMIREKGHYKSGVVEAGIYVGLLFIAFGLLGVETENMISYALLGLVVSTFATIRYLDILTLLLAFFFLGWTLVLILTMSVFLTPFLPFVFMAIFGLIYWLSTLLETKLSSAIFDTHFTIIQTLALLIIYLAGNYFVVRQLNGILMGGYMDESTNIPHAFLFYILTAVIPIGYLYWGIKKKSILWIRVSLLVLTLSVVTFKIYFSLGHPVVSVTIAGAILIAVALILFRYLKTVRYGFTCEKLLNDKWGSKNLTAFIASQTLGGNAINNPSGNATTLNGGEFGGAGAGSNW